MVLSNYKYMQNSNTEFQDPIPVITSTFQACSSNRIKIQVILLILQLETDYFSSYSFQNLKQWHYSLHRDFQNSYSTRRSPTGFFSSNSTWVPTYVYINPEEFSIQNPILHAEDRELFEYYYYTPKTFQRHSRHSSHKTFQRHSRHS